MSWQRSARKIQKLIEEDSHQAEAMFNAIAGGEEAGRYLRLAIKYSSEVEFEMPEARISANLGMSPRNLHFAYKDLSSRGLIKIGQVSIKINLDAVSSALSAHRRGKESKGTSGVVYLAKGQTFHKIGKTTDINVRAAQIRLQMPFPVEIIHKIQCENIHAVEREWHKKFAHRRKNGEWFELTAQEVAEFCRHNKM